jgi:hypothetical protein
MEAFLARYNAWREGREIIPSLERRPATAKIGEATPSEQSTGRLAS